MLKNPLHSCCLIVSAVAMTGYLMPVQRARAGEPQTASVMILLDASNIATTEGCLEDAVAIVFSASSIDNSSTVKTLEANPAYGLFSGQNLAPLNAKYITRGHVNRGAVWGLDAALPPNHGAMLFDPNSDVVVEFCGFVTDNSNTLEVDPLGELLLVIATGTVY